MFGLAKNLYQYLRKRKDRLLTLVLVGLDNAGKSTLLCTLRGVGSDNVTPTWGFASESIIDGKYKLDIYDLGGGRNIRKIWERYYAEVHGAVYVVDAADKDRIQEAKEELHNMLRDPYLAGKPLLIFANKQDLPTAMSAAETAAALDLSSFQNSRHQIVQCTAKTPMASTDPAVQKGMKWLMQQIESEYSKLNVRVEQEAKKMRAEEERKKAERKARVEQQRAERKAQEAEEAAGEPLQAEGAGAVAEALAVSNKSSENLMQHSVSSTLSAPTPPPKHNSLKPISSDGSSPPRQV